jgi:hypothetical protein
MVFNTLLIKESILPTSFDNVLLDADLVDNAGLVDFSSSAGTIFTVHAALGCPFSPHRNQSLSL